MSFICEDIVNNINKCVNNNEFHIYKYYKNIDKNEMNKNYLLECDNFKELKDKLKNKNGIKIEVINNDYLKKNDTYSYNIFYNRYTNRVSICL